MRVDSGSAGQRSLPRASERGVGLPFSVRVASVLRRVAGMPDYHGYTEHLRRYHPEMPVPSEQEYYAEYLRTRYGDNPSRCC
jgi:uncharacterized short protein YbdD (DUF466 family)